ncbi:MAG: tetratricopeptide repeat protein [Abditibacteriota bacterium]|nr:tetratricopeptide repeat protein [Abditibacteriota bacterium]
MKKLILSTILLCIFTVFANAYTITADAELEKYKSKVEEELGSLITEVINAREIAYDLFLNEKEITEEITYLLGCEDKKSQVFQDVHYNLYDSHIIITTLNNIKIKSYEEVSKNPTLQTGYISYEFGENNAVNIVFSSLTGEGDENSFYLPVLINNSGEIVKKEELVNGLIAICGNTKMKGALMLYNNVNTTLTEILKIDYPFSRWYNEGMSYKVTSLILNKLKSPLASDFDNLFSTTKESEELISQINLWNFAQLNLTAKSDYNHKLETAHVQAACRLMDSLYDKVGREGFHKLNTELKYSEFLTNEQICKIANDILGVDLKEMLFQYVPESCKQLIGKTNPLNENAKALMDEKKYKEAIPVLETVLTANPYDLNARLNLARCYREEKDIVNSDKEIFLAANATIPGNSRISIYGENNEQILVIIGKYLFISEAVNDAYKFLSKAYETDKSEDIKQILDSIDLTRENIKKEIYGGN